MELNAATTLRLETLATEGCEGTELLQPDTPSTISETASEVRPTAPFLETTDAASVSPQRPLSPRNNPSEPTKTRTSKYRGVCWNKKNRRWQAAINNGGRYVYLGSYVLDDEAARAFDLAALQIRGKNAKLNFRIEDYPESEWVSGAPPHLAEKYEAIKPGQRPLPAVTSSPLCTAKNMEPYALHGFHAGQNRMKNIEERIIQSRSEFGRAEEVFFRDSLTKSAEVRIKQEAESTGVLDTCPPTGELTFKKLAEINVTPSAETFVSMTSTGFPGGLFADHSATGHGLTLKEKRNAEERPSRKLNCSADDAHGHRPDVCMKRFEDSSTKSKGYRPDLPGRNRYEDSTSKGKGGNPVNKIDDLGDSAEKAKGHMRSHIDIRADDSSLQDTVKRRRLDMNPHNPKELPVPLVQPSLECRALQVSSMLPQAVQGSDIEEAKLIVGSGRNHFGLIHRMVNNKQWSSLVWDGDTMHDMGLYGSENDAQAACVAAVQLIEVILSKDN